MSGQQPNAATESVAQQGEESFRYQENENGTKEDAENDPSKKLQTSNKGVNAVIAVKKVNRSVSTCKLPIDINLYILPKLSKLGSTIQRERKRSILNIGSYYRLCSNNQLGISRAVCFDNPSSCSSSQVSVKFINVDRKRPCSGKS